MFVKIDLWQRRTNVLEYDGNLHFVNFYLKLRIKKMFRAALYCAADQQTPIGFASI